MSFASRLRADLASWLDRGEDWLRPADQVDYLVRRLVIPIRLEASRPDRTPSPQGSGMLAEIQAEIGRRLRAEYDLAQPVPPRLMHLLREVERRATSEGIA